jgi:hypothetical protein
MHGVRKRTVVIPRVWYWGYVKMDKRAYALEDEYFVIYHGFRNKHIIMNSKPLCPVFWVTAVYAAFRPW